MFASASSCRKRTCNDKPLRKAKLADVVHAPIQKSGIDYVSNLDSQTAAEKMITFSMTDVSAFSNLKSLAEHCKGCGLPIMMYSGTSQQWTRHPDRLSLASKRQ